MSVDETANTVTLTSDKDTDAVLVQASYRTDNTLDSVKKVVNLELKANEAKLVPATDLATFTTNDKIMVWDSLKTMTPLANACTVKNGAAQATAKPAPTAEPTEAPTAELRQKLRQKQLLRQIHRLRQLHLFLLMQYQVL